MRSQIQASLICSLLEITKPQLSLRLMFSFLVGKTVYERYTYIIDYQYFILHFFLFLPNMVGIPTFNISLINCSKITIIKTKLFRFGFQYW
jgi:hypothetical protein